jgi:hypothetical protein
MHRSCCGSPTSLVERVIADPSRLCTRMGLNAGYSGRSYQGLVCTLFENGPRVMCGTERRLEKVDADS